MQQLPGACLFSKIVLMSRAQRAATALHLFDEEDQANLQEVALDYFTAPSVTTPQQWRIWRSLEVTSLEVTT